MIPEVVLYEENGEDAISLDYARLIPLLIEAIKESDGRAIMGLSPQPQVQDGRIQ